MTPTRALPALLLAAACTSAAKDGDSHSRPVDDSGSGTSCTEDASLFTFEPRLGPVETVVVVPWEATRDVVARVVYVDTASPEAVLATPASGAAASGLVNVIGLRPNRTIELHLEAEEDGQTVCSPEVTITTGSLPAELPEMVVSTAVEGRVEGWETVAVIREKTSFATILDADGGFVWASEVPSTIYRATLSRDRGSVLSNQPPQLWTAAGTLRKTPIGEGDEKAVEVIGAHTDFVELPDGTVATLGWANKLFDNDTRNLLGDTIIEVNPDGTQTEVWNIFDHVEPNLDTVYAPSPVSTGEEVPFLEEWSHVNSINYDEASDDYLVTGSFNHSVMRIDRATGDMLWVVTDGGGASDFEVVSDVRELELPHSAQLTDDGTVLAFSRGAVGSEDDPAACAWVTELALDEAAGLATPVMHYSSDDCVTIPYLGEARRIDEGNTMVTWSPAGRLSQLDADQALVFQLDLDLGSAFGFGEWTAGLY